MRRRGWQPPLELAGGAGVDEQDPQGARRRDLVARKQGDHRIGIKTSRGADRTPSQRQSLDQAQALDIFHRIAALPRSHPGGHDNAVVVLPDSQRRG